MNNPVEYIALKGGVFSPNTVDYESLMRRRIKKSQNSLQPIFEAFSNSMEATSGANNSITIELHHVKNQNIFGEEYSYGAISIVDDGDGFNTENFKRLERLYDESKNKNNLGSGRVQYLHFFKVTQIESYYTENGETHLRQIELSKDFFKDHYSVIRSLDSVVDASKSGTRITFFFPLSDEDKQKYESFTTSDIKDAIIKRYLHIFVCAAIIFRR